MRKSLSSALQVIGQTAGFLAAVAWGWTCWKFLAQQDVNASSQESRGLFRLLCFAVVTVPVAGFFVYWPFAALADRVAPRSANASTVRSGRFNS
jgi:hypothetical protein